MITTLLLPFVYAYTAAAFALMAMIPILAVGAIGIFVMLFIGAGIEMLKMAAY